MNTVIKVMARSVYGNVLLYPANDQANRLAGIVGTRTLTMTVLSQAVRMGFEIEVTGDVVNAAGIQDTLNKVAP